MVLLVSFTPASMQSLVHQYCGAPNEFHRAYLLSLANFTRAFFFKSRCYFLCITNFSTDRLKPIYKLQWMHKQSMASTNLTGVLSNFYIWLKACTAEHVIQDPSLSRYWSLGSFIKLMHIGSFISTVQSGCTCIHYKVNRARVSNSKMDSFYRTSFYLTIFILFHCLNKCIWQLPDTVTQGGGNQWATLRKDVWFHKIA